ncbi:hypothetical protein [Shewanella algae]|uniref:hypothetical protein n=1 Tax=Shewanella algae TaxID=38313 RepID=UPI00131FBF60|nr:hypothetical protein [Shewanella algae]QHD53515.1 hypothetical protein GM320_10315 [Shewanella algae]
MNKFKLKNLSLMLLGLTLSAPSLAVDISGSIRANYSIKDFSDASKATGGDFDFNTLGIKLSQDFENYGFVAEYRFADGYDYLKNGYAYWNANEDLTLQLGVVSKAFGNKNFASHNWWYSLNYYLGFEDDYGVGFNINHKFNNFETDFSFIQSSLYKGSDYRNFAGTIGSGTIDGTTYNNKEYNTVSLRESYRWENDNWQVLLGASVEYGQLYNPVADESGDNLNYAVHLDAKYRGWGVQLQYLKYDFDQYDDSQIDTSKIGIGAVNGFYEVAAKGDIMTFNLSKVVDTQWGGQFTFYNDFSILTADESNFDDSVLNSTGVSLSYKQFFVYVDYYHAKNVVWLGDNSLGLKDSDKEWNGRFNIHLQYWF